MSRFCEQVRSTVSFLRGLHGSLQRLDAAWAVWSYDAVAFQDPPSPTEPPQSTLAAGVADPVMATPATSRTAGDSLTGPPGTPQPPAVRHFCPGPCVSGKTHAARNVAPGRT